MGQPIELFIAHILVVHVFLGGTMVRTKKESLVKIITLLILQVVVQGSQIDVVSKSIGILAFLWHFTLSRIFGHGSELLVDRAEERHALQVLEHDGGTYVQRLTRTSGPRARRCEP